MTTTKPNAYEQLTNRLIQMIETAQATGDAFQLPWRRAGNGFRRPTNHVTGRAYRGINVCMLWGTAAENGYGVDEWATFKQWKTKGASVRKGEKGTPVLFFKELTVDDERTESGERRIPMARISYVFNIAQVDGVEMPTPVDLQGLEDKTRQIATADAFIRGTGASVRHGGEDAYFHPGLDVIQMPERVRFIGESDTATERYYSTLLHELTHWTGHKSRLDRETIARYALDIKDRAAEELIAELGAAFLCADLGVSNAPRADHAQYLASWLKALKSDARHIVKAASAADKACDYLKNLQDAAALDRAA